MKWLSVCVLLFLANSCLAAENCVWADDNCECTASDGGEELKLNIRGYFTYPLAISQEGTDWTYVYSPCSKRECIEGQGSKSRMCQKGASESNNCGSNIASWVINSRSPLSFTISYDDGNDGRVTNVDFDYKDEDNKMEIISSKSKIYDFVVTGRSVKASTGPGPSPSKGGGGGGGEDIAGPIGLALISLFIISVVAYFVIGGVVNYFHRGARGVEIIPNYSFWKDFPFLIKDGFLFTISPCYKPALEKISYQSL